MIKDHDHLIKLILIGNSGVGKTSILTQFADNKFSQTYLTTIGVDFRFRTLGCDGKTIKFQIWDTAGQERFRTITSAYYKGADGIIMVYDVTDEGSVEDLAGFWVSEAFNYCDRDIPVLVLGNKSDCPNKISPTKIEDLVKNKATFQHRTVSAKENSLIQQSIKNFGLRIIKVKEDRRAASTPAKIFESQKNSLQKVQVGGDGRNQKQKKKCC